MRDDFAKKWRDYKSLSDSDGRIKESTIELKQAQDKQCAIIQKMIVKEYGSDELERIIKGVRNYLCLSCGEANPSYLILEKKQ